MKLGAGDTFSIMYFRRVPSEEQVVSNSNLESPSVKRNSPSVLDFEELKKVARSRGTLASQVWGSDDFEQSLFNGLNFVTDSSIFEISRFSAGVDSIPDSDGFCGTFS